MFLHSECSKAETFVDLCLHQKWCDTFHMLCLCGYKGKWAMAECVHLCSLCVFVCVCVCTIIDRAGQCPELTPANHTAVQTSNRWPLPGHKSENVAADNMALLLALE